MKKIYSLIALAILVFSTTAVAAPAKKSSKKGNPDLHGVAIWGGAGYSGIVNKTDNSKFIGGGGGLIGVGYEYQHKKFILNIGPEFRLFSSKDKMTQLDNPYKWVMPNTNVIWDGTTWQSAASLERHYNFDNFSENQVVGQLMLPILAGAQFEKWYFMAGVKLGYTVLGNYKQRGDYVTTAYDPVKLSGDYADMASHDLGEYEYKSNGKNKFGFDATLSAEVGLNLDPYMPDSWLYPKGTDNLPMLHYRLGVFADYGLKNLKLNNESPMIAINGEDGVPYSTSLHQSTYQTGRLNSLLVGVKFTVFFQMNKPKLPKQPNPRMVAYTFDSHSGKALSQTKVVIATDQPKKRPVTKYTNQNGLFTQRFAAGNYNLQVSKNDYLPQELSVQHQSDATDTLRFALIPVPVFQLYVVDAKTEQPMEAKANFMEQGTDKVLESHNVNEKGLSVKLKMDKQYIVQVSAPNYVEQMIEIDTIASTITARLNPIEKGRKYVIENLFFASAQTQILPESEEALQQLFEFLSDNPEVRIRIIGHTDSIGTDHDNQVLSEGRANSVRQSMIERGIDGDRIEAEGRGEREPVATNDTEEGRQKNRRVEFVTL